VESYERGSIKTDNKETQKTRKFLICGFCFLGNLSTSTVQK